MDPPSSTHPHANFTFGSHLETVGQTIACELTVLNKNWLPNEIQKFKVSLGNLKKKRQNYAEDYMYSHYAEDYMYSLWFQIQPYHEVLNLNQDLRF